MLDGGGLLDVATWQSEMTSSLAGSPPAMLRPPILEIAREAQEAVMLEEFKELGILGLDADVEALRNLDLGLLEGFGMQEYWLVPCARRKSGIKEELFAARFEGRIERRADANTPKRRVMVQVVYTDRQQQWFDMPRLVSQGAAGFSVTRPALSHRDARALMQIEAYTGSQGISAKQGIVRFLSKAQVDEIFVPLTNYDVRGVWSEPSRPR
jgi:hypothetical protein